MMSRESLYLKWRPQDFGDVVGQAHVTRTLRNACLSGRIAHAYLFAGPRGTGKTSVARILAKALNCLAAPEDRPCNRCRICLAVSEGRFLDLIEIDAASNRGIDEIRDIREKVSFRPSEGRYKVYIIDEAHMLTREAFNALLKTLEEPPQHVIFVLATTEVWRLPATVRSRCQRFDFRPLREDQIESRLRQICEAERIGRDDTALWLIARQAAGSLRDAVGILDQIAAIGDGMVTAELVRSVLGLAPTESAQQLLQYLFSADLAGALELVGQVVAEGRDVRQFALDVLALLRAMLLLRAGARPSAELAPELLAQLEQWAQALEPRAILRLLRSFGAVVEEGRTAQLAQLPLELAVVESHLSLAEGSLRPAQPSPQPAPQQPRPLSKPVQPALSEELALPRLQRLWPKVLAKIYTRDRMLEALLRATEPISLADGKLTVAFTYPFHCAWFADPRESAQLAAVVEEVAGLRVAIEPVVVRPGAAPAAEPRAAEKKEERVSDLSSDPLYRTLVQELGGELRGVDEASAQRLEEEGT
jgi:DNA polymerase-3 subunit gamma/tau